MINRKIFYYFEISLFILILFGAFLFTYENTREKIIEDIIEKKSKDIDIYIHIYNSLKNNNLSSKDLNYLNSLINNLKRNNFILSEDLDIYTAIIEYQKGNITNSIEILKSIINNSIDNINRADATIELANILINLNNLNEAIELLVNNSYLFSNYKKEDYYLKLMELYFKTKKFELFKEYITYLNIVPVSHRSIYKQIISSNWNYLTQYQKRKILYSLISMDMYESYIELAKMYINEYTPSINEVENILFDLVNNCHKYYVKSFIENIKNNTNYNYICSVMLDFYNMKNQNIFSSSAKIRGAYYNKILSDINYKGRYDYKKAYNTYTNYLKGEVEIEYVRKNIILTIRNFIAYKKYNLINEIVDKTYQKLNLIENNGIINDFTSFWNGYTYFINSNWVEALKNFEKTFVYAPESYYSILSLNYISKIQEIDNNLIKDYINNIKHNVESSTNISDKLYFLKILYSLSKDEEKEYYRNKIKNILANYNNNSLFIFNFEDLNNIKNSKEYLKFIIYTRAGLIERARALLSLANINDTDIQNVIMLKELLYVKNFKLAKQFLFLLDNSQFINENFPFLSQDLKKLFYPEPYNEEITKTENILTNIKIDKYLIHSIIRQESLYLPDTKSSAGAIGIMQLMPATGRLVAKSVIKNKKYNLYNTFDNILLGTKFLYDSINYYGFITALATYNGGIGIVSKIKKQFSPQNEIELVEIIPYGETREYVRSIFKYYYNYTNIYNNTDISEIAGLIKENSSL